MLVAPWTENLEMVKSQITLKVSAFSDKLTFNLSSTSALIQQG